MYFKIQNKTVALVLSAMAQFYLMCITFIKQTDAVLSSSLSLSLLFSSTIL